MGVYSHQLSIDQYKVRAKRSGEGTVMQIV